MASFLEIHSPQPPTQCVPTTFSWNGGIAPYTLKVTAVTDNNIGDTLQAFTGILSQSFLWSANLPAGTNFGIVLSDSTPITVQFEPVPILPGPDSSCLGGSSVFTSSVGASSTSSESTVASATNSVQTLPPSSITSASAASTDTGTATSASASASATDPASVSGTTTKSLSNGAIAGIAIGAALLGILFAALLFWLWRWRRTRKTRAMRERNLNESTLTPFEIPRTSKAAMMREPLMSTAHNSPTSVNFAQYPSGVPSSSVLPPSPSSPCASASAVGSRPASYVPPSPNPNRLSIVGSEGARSMKASEFRRLTLGQNWNSHLSVGGLSEVTSIQESDAGVRLAGGPPPPVIEVTESEGGESSQGPIPPPYHRYDE